MLLLPKLTIIRDREYLDGLHDEPCIISGLRGTDQETVDPAHIGAFKGMKRSDDETLPLMHRFHQYGHDHGEMTMWRVNMPDWLLRDALRAYAREFYQRYKLQRTPS